MRERIITIILIAVFFCFGSLGTYLVMSNYVVSNSTDTATLVKKNVTVTESDSINESIMKVYDSVVVIGNYNGGRLAGYGSGFIYKKDNKYGYILTNNHVVSGASEIKVTLTSGEEIKGKVLGTDTYMDIAVVAIDASKVNGVAIIGDSSKSKLGDTVFTVGTPVSPEYSGSVTKGIVSGQNREITVSNNGITYVMEAIQIDASINPGNSGGPLVNINGEVIGVNSVKLVESSIEGMGFAIPIEVAMAQIEKLEKGEAIERPVIGISTYDLSAVAAYYGNSNVQTGVVVNFVQAGSDASKAGIEINDIITKVDGVTVKSQAHLKYLLYKHKLGDELKVTVNRNGKEKELTLKLTHKIGD